MKTEDQFLAVAMLVRNRCQADFDAEDEKWHENPKNWEPRYKAQQRLRTAEMIVEACCEASTLKEK